MERNIRFKKKYLKYKSKYLNIKKLIGGSKILQVGGGEKQYIVSEPKPVGSIKQPAAVIKLATEAQAVDAEKARTAEAN